MPIVEFPQKISIAEMSPREIFFASSEVVPFEKSVGRICAEEVTFYPPGIPIINLGERIKLEVIEQIRNLQALGGRILGDKNFVKVI